MELSGVKIGSGAFASVFECEMDSSAVVKISHNYDFQKEVLANEIYFFESIPSCDLIPKFLGQGVTKTGRPYLIIERFVADLENTYFETGEEKIAALDGVMRAIEFIHSNGFVHGDITSRNVLVSGSKTVLADFGSCSDLSSKSDFEKLEERMEDFNQFVTMMLKESVNLKFSKSVNLEKRIGNIANKFLTEDCSKAVEELIAEPPVAEYAKNVLKTLKESFESEAKLLLHS